MQNKKSDIDDIEATIEGLGCEHNPGPAATMAAKTIDDTYVLIKKKDLPKITFGFIGEGGTPSLSHITSKASKGDPKAMRELGYEYLVMADYVEEKARKEEDDLIQQERYHAYIQLNPGSEVKLRYFSWEHVPTTFERHAIDLIVDLKRQLDKK